MTKIVLPEVSGGGLRGDRRVRSQGEVSGEGLRGRSQGEVAGGGLKVRSQGTLLAGFFNPIIRLTKTWYD